MLLAKEAWQPLTVLSLSSENLQNQAILAYRLKFCREFSASVRILSAAVKSGLILHCF